ncbi:MAG: hypothetical protein A3F16_01155 [Deltaproteobacteria bacterium RIFCSPHIGHO2_12_FULL_43_9]|nr:MAG: hypothetical protein A3F16_01155 [Deltaproteobacteria bacterium RIFCSPHIGHO2_12_FULL_43_9]
MTEKDSPVSIDFSTFAVSLGSAALMGLGLAKNPATGNFEKNLDSAKLHIDLLTMLKEKTKGNLTKEEEELLNALLYDTKMRYVEVVKGESKEETKAK